MRQKLNRHPASAAIVDYAIDEFHASGTECRVLGGDPLTRVVSSVTLLA
jgi:hypothetical protein